jgi:hypothetical protein
MKCLNLAYSRDFNDRHDRVGQFIRRRYGNRRITSGADLLGVYFYVVANPVVARLSVHPADWRWSSYPTTAGIARDFPFVDASLAVAEAGGSVEELRKFVHRRTAELSAEMAMTGVRHRTWPFEPAQAMTSTRFASGAVRDSRSSTSRRARIETSI